MAFVSVPKDLSKIKTKVALNLTLRQIICFSIAAVIGLPVYLYSRDALGSDLAVYVMIASIMPFFFAAVFEKDGIVFEKYVGHIIRQKFINPKIRLYKTENFYEYLDNIGKEVAASGIEKSKKAGQTKGKRATAKKPEQEIYKESECPA